MDNAEARFTRFITSIKPYNVTPQLAIIAISQKINLYSKTFYLSILAALDGAIICKHAHQQVSNELMNPDPLSRCSLPTAIQNMVHGRACEVHWSHCIPQGFEIYPTLKNKSI